MNIAFIHYHLMRGGVTTVIRHQVEALNAAGWNVLVLAGGHGGTDFPAQVVTIPELGYSSLDSTAYSSEYIAKKIISAIQAHWPEGADVVHVHNPTLAKNRYLQEVLDHLQQSGMRLLCQIHDFAEDGRPGAYLAAPYLSNCHYAVLNERDHRLLIEAGLKVEGCHLLPNAISPLGGQSSPSPGGDYILYPIRAIRRKNIGEALLLSRFFDEGTFLAITLPPNSAADIASYNIWRSFSERHHLSVRFDVGVHADFFSLMAGCRFVLTTSITEGFGFAYLEPWTAGKALWGRLLPGICQGFINQGLDLKHLYTRLSVLLDWLDADAFKQQWKAAMVEASRQFQISMHPRDVDASWQLISEAGCIDFGLLSERFQQQAIKRIIGDARAAHTLKDLNPFLENPSPPEPIGPVIQRNSDIISNTWNLDQYGHHLLQMYRAVVDCDVRQTIDKQTLSRFFLSPHLFSLLKWEAFNG